MPIEVALEATSHQLLIAWNAHVANEFVTGITVLHSWSVWDGLAVTTLPALPGSISIHTILALIAGETFVCASTAAWEYIFTSSYLVYTVHEYRNEAWSGLGTYYMLRACWV